MLNLGKSRIRARDGRVAAGLRAEALRIAGTLALLANPTASGQSLAALPRKAPPASKPVAALMRRLTGGDLTQCPVCRQGRMHVVAAVRSRAGPIPALDTS